MINVTSGTFVISIFALASNLFRYEDRIWLRHDSLGESKAVAKSGKDFEVRTFNATDKVEIMNTWEFGAEYIDLFTFVIKQKERNYV